MSKKHRVRLPDGRYVNITADNAEIAARAAQRYYEKNPTPPKPKKEESWWDIVTDGDRSISERFWDSDKKIGEYVSPLAGEFVDGLLPNWGDELYAAPRAVGAFLRGEDAGEAFDKAQKHYIDRQERFGRENPKASSAATGTGVVGSLALPAGRVAQTAGTVEKAKKGAQVAAAYGGITGAGAGDGLEERATNAGYGAAVGGTFGAALPPAVVGSAKAGQWARMNIPGVDNVAQFAGSIPGRVTSAITGRQAAPRVSPAVARANQLAAREFNRGNIRPGASQAEIPTSEAALVDTLNMRHDAGVPAMVGDMTDGLRNLTGWSSRGVGPGQAMVRERLAQRKAGEGNRVRGYVQDNLPTTQDPIRFVEETQKAMKEAARPLYQEAYERPMYRTDAIQGIEQTPAFRDALPNAFRNIRNQIDPATGRPKDPSAMGFRWFDGDPNGLPPNTPYFPNPDGPGYITWDKGLSTEGYDQVVRAMSDSGRAASNVNPVTGKIESTTNSVHINDLTKNLRQELVDQNPPYAQAVERYADDSATINAFNQGRDVSKLTGPEIAAQGRATPEAFRPAWSTGAGTALADDAAAHGAKYPMGETANRTRQALGDEAKQKAIGEMTGDPQALSRLQDLLEAERQAVANFKGVHGNSATANRQAFDDDMAEGIGALPQSWPDAARRFVGFLSQYATPNYKNEVRDRIAEIVTSTDARTVTEVIQAVEAEAARNASFRQLLTQSGIRLSGLYGRSVEPVVENQEP